jgi:RNA recognition motif-containing protein
MSPTRGSANGMQVEKMFGECGTVVFVRFAYDEQKSFRGFCHITFKGTTGVAVEKAMEFDGAEVGGRVLKVGRAEGKKKHTDDPRGKKLGKNRREGGEQWAGGDSEKTATAGSGGGKPKQSSGEVGGYSKRSSAEEGNQATKKVKYFNQRDE